MKGNDMINLGIAIGWFVSFISLFFGYVPSKFAIGCAFLICTIERIQVITNKK